MFFDDLTMCPAGLRKLYLVTLLENAYLWQAVIRNHSKNVCI